MRNHRIWAVALMVSALPASSAFAANIRTFVASTGADSGVCSREMPCRSFAYAIGQTASNGEIIVLDSAGYGSVTITESITISNPSGVEAAITAPPNGNAVTINATAPINVTLRGLTLIGATTGLNGIAVTTSVPVTATSAGAINILDCVAKDFTGAGISVTPSREGSARIPGPPMLVTLTNTTLLNNAQSGLHASQNNIYLRLVISDLTATGNGIGADISAGTGTGTVQFVLANSLLGLNGSGIVLSGAVQSTIKHSVVKTNGSSPNDVTNNGLLSLVNNNLVGTLTNNLIVQSDKTNVIELLNGSTPQTINLQ